jgi:DNA mismatch repair protein MutS
MIYDDYIEYSRKYAETYGKQTVVFMQVGDFFELYAIDNDDERAGADIYTVSDICNLQVSRKNKAILENSRQNPLMAGFPLSIVSKHIQTMVEHGYTVIVIRQVTPPPNPRREVTEIVSPATQMQPQGTDHTYLMALYWEFIPVAYGSKKFHWAVGMAAVDITTGDVIVAEALPKMGDRHFAKDEAYRWMQMFQPRELLMAGAAPPEERTELYEDLQLDVWKIHRNVHERWDTPTLKTYQKITYQEQVFQKLYGGDSLIERLGLERSDGIRVALVHAIQFIYEHNEGMLQSMKRPMKLNPIEHCSVHYNALLQLNVLSHTPGERPLVSLLNRCSTAFGSRLFKERLLNPILRKETLNERYAAIETLMMHPDLATLKKHLGKILDLERFARRLILKQLAPCEWVPITQSLQHVAKIHEIGGEDGGITADLEHLQEPLQFLQKTIETHLVLEEASKYWMGDIRGSFFHPGHYPELDACQTTTMVSLNHLNALAAEISTICGGDETCKLENNDRYGYYLSMTKKRWDTVISREPPMGYKWKEFKAIAISSSSSVLRITHPSIDTWSNTLLADQKKLGVLATECYKDFLETHGGCIAAHLETLVVHLAKLDVALTNARNAIDFCYHRPTFAASSSASLSASYIAAKGMRHPIIERLQMQTPYVPNDIALGKDAADGWLLYGINASGKSSLMKAIGLNLLMAQAGMFVPCESFEYEPYHAIFTRISGADNIYRGMSSFTVEMTELRNILLRCDARSLVLGDELCAGTEALSALSIVAAGVETLAEKKASFVFATHLHELVRMGFLPKNVAVFHIHIHIDPDTNQMTFDRHLTPGSGHAYYGLEVCRALDLPDVFIQKANQYRRQIQEESTDFVNTKTSNYNAAVFMDKCALCSNPATETHHIHYQKDARAAGGKKKHVFHIPIHSAQNLVPLCDACHVKEHQGVFHIHGFQKTSMGRILKVSYTSAAGEAGSTSQ